MTPRSLLALCLVLAGGLLACGGDKPSANSPSMGMAGMSSTGMGAAGMSSPSMGAAGMSSPSMGAAGMGMAGMTGK